MFMSMFNCAMDPRDVICRHKMARYGSQVTHTLSFQPKDAVPTVHILSTHDSLHWMGFWDKCDGTRCRVLQLRIIGHYNITT